MRFSEWILQSRPDVLDRGRCLLHGEEVGFGTLNNKRLREAIREHYREGQDALKDFVRWLIRHEGLSEENARRNAAAVWNTYCMTWNHDENRAYPERLLTSNVYKKGSIALVRTALLRYARFSKNLDLVAKIHEIRDANRPTIVEKDIGEGIKLQPYTNGEIDALLAAVEELRGDPRWPWGWSVFRLIVLAGVSTAELSLLGKDQILDALRDGAIVLWRPKRGPRSLPVDIVRRELEVFVSWPWNWSTLADIVAPGVGRETREGAIVRAIRNLARIVFGKANVEWKHEAIAACRWASAIRYYERTRNFVGVAHLVGIRDVRKVEKLLVMMTARQKEREKLLEQGSVVDEAESEADGDE